MGGSIGGGDWQRVACAAAMLWASSIALAQINSSDDPGSVAGTPSETAAGAPSDESGRVIAPGTERVVGPDSPRWEIRFEPSAWFMSPAGKLRLPRTASNGSQVELVDLGLDHTEIYPFGELHFVRNRWRITLGGAWLGDDATAIATASGALGDAAYSPGDTIATDITFASFQALGAVEVFDYQGGANKRGGFDLDARVELTGGVRVYAIDVGARVSASPGGAVLTRSDDNQFFIEPVIGVKATVVLLEDFSIDSEVTIGGMAWDDSSVFSVDVIVGGAWHPTRNLGVQLGYRQLAYFLQSGSAPGKFEFNGTLAGLYGGLDLRF